MNRRTLGKFTNYGISFILSIVFFVAGSRLLYADFKRTTTVTTTTAPTVTVTPPPVMDQPPVIEQEVVTQEPAVIERRTVVRQPAAVAEHRLVPAAVTQKQIQNFITYDLDIKKVFQSNENIRGSVIVRNASAAPLADSFHIKLYHRGKLVKELITRMTDIPPGQSRFSLKDFGIPQINETTASQGDWTIGIYDIDPAYTKNADFRIINSTSSNNLLR